MKRILSSLLLFTFLVPIALADDGMWTFDNPPLAQWKAKYNFEPSKEWLDRLREVLAGLPEGQAGKGKIYTTTDRQLQAGEAMLDMVFIDMAIVAGAQAPAAGVRIRNTNAQLGEFAWPAAAPLWFHFFVAGEGGNRLDQTASFSIDGTWSLVRLLDKYNAERSAADKRLWYLKLPVSYKGTQYFTWLKIEMDRELPDLETWRKLKAAP